MQMLLEIRVPLLSVNDQSLSIAEITLKTGDKVNKGDVIAVLETSKTTYSVEAETEGYIEYHCAAGDDLPVNEIMAVIYDELPVAGQPAINSAGAGSAVNQGVSFSNPVKQAVTHTLFSNKALQLMDELHLGKKDFEGYDLVNADDVRLKADPSFKLKKNIQPEKKQPVAHIPDDEEKVSIEKLKSNKLREIEYLTSVQSSGLVSVINTVIELDDVSSFLQHHLRYFKDSLLPVIIYETSRLLAIHRVFNAYYNNQSVAYYKEVNVGFAVDIDKGLKVVKIPRTNTLSLTAVEEEMLRLSNAYLDDKLSIDDLSDITFTITDLSGEQVASFLPLINMKNSAILGISSIDRKLNRCTVSLAFDHRVTEGRQAAVFLAALKTRIESYHSMATSEQYKKNQLEAVQCYRCMKTLAEDLAGVGFVKCITPEGKEDYICQACIKGF